MKPHRYLLPERSSKKYPKTPLSDHKGTPLTLTVASLGLLIFLVGTFTLPFNHGLFSKLFTKPFSHAMMMTPRAVGCQFYTSPGDQPAFCDDFSEGPSQNGGRNGTLDPALWSFSHAFSSNLGQGMAGYEPYTVAQFCKDKVVGILPTADSFFCGPQFGEPMHWMETFNDNGNYVFDSARILQPFDFTNRTGTIVFDVDAKNAGSHSWWPELWITDEPIPDPHNNQIIALPRNGIDISFNNDCGQSYNKQSPVGAIGEIQIIKNYQAIAQFGPGNGFTLLSCYTAASDMANHFEVRISQNHLEVWATDDDGSNFHEIISADNLNLPFTRGYLHFQHAQYNAFKAHVTDQQTYHWHNIGFDGPILPRDRTYNIPDAFNAANTDRPGDGINLAYYLNSQGTFICCGQPSPLPPFTLNNVDLSSATGAAVHMDTEFYSATDSINYRLNGGTWHNFPYPTTDAQPFLWGAPTPITIPVSLSELKTGTNTIEFNQDDPANALIIHNIDLTVFDSVTPPPPPSPQPFVASSPLPVFPPNDFKVQTIVTPTQIASGSAVTITTSVTNITSSPITAKGALAVLGPNQNQDGFFLLGNKTSTTFEPGVPVNYTENWTSPIVCDGSNCNEYAYDYLGKFSIIESILSPDSSTIYYTNPDIADFTVTSTSFPPPTPPPSESPTPVPTPMIIGSNTFNASVTPSPLTVDAGGTVSLTTNVTNVSSSDITGQILMIVLDPNNNLVSSQWVSMNGSSQMDFSPNMAHTHILSLTLPSDATPGIYTVEENIRSADSSTTLYSSPEIATFDVGSSLVSPTPSPSQTPTPTPSPTVTPTPNPSSCPTKTSDFNNDGSVNLTDLSIFSANFGTSSPNIPDPCTDMNQDGVVNLTDLSLFAAVYGT